QLQDTANPRVLVTSARPAEGKTTVAINLGAVLAQVDRSVVVVDTDIDDPQVAERVGASHGPGLTDVLCGQTALFEAVQHGAGGLKNLAVLDAGKKIA